MKIIKIPFLFILGISLMGCGNIGTISGKVSKTIPVSYRTGVAYATDIVFEDGRQIRFQNTISIPLTGKECTLVFDQHNDDQSGHILKQITVGDTVTQVP